MNHRGFLKTGVIGALDVVGQTIANNEGLMLSQPAPTQIQCANLSINSLILKRGFCNQRKIQFHIHSPQTLGFNRCHRIHIDPARPGIIVHA